MSNSTCPFSSINDLLLQGQHGLVNITATIDTCPQICLLAWGHGSPDLSGIGANISYIIQATFTIIFGPLLLLFYKMHHRLKIQISPDGLSDLHDTFLNTSAQFSIPVAIAAVVRITQKAPFYELAFLRALTTMQFLSLLSTVVIAGLIKRPHPRHVVIVVLYILIEFGFYMGLIGSLSTTDNAIWTSLVELTDACKVYGQIFPWIHGLNTVNFNVPKWKIYFIISGFGLAAIVGLMLIRCIFYGLSRIAMFLREHKVGWIVVVLMSLAFGIAVQVELAEMERLRNLMKGITGPDFQDDKWSFGQIIALFLWVPLCIQFVFYVIDAFRVSH